MELKKFALLCSVSLLSACAYKPTPYEVVQTVNYQQGALTGNYKLGVTEQRVADIQYVVVVKLDSGSSALRAKNMLLLHAANMAINNGYDGFTGKKVRAGRWCNKSRNKATGQVFINDGGPTAKAIITFEALDAQNNKKKVKNAQNIINKFTNKVDHVISAEQAEQNSKNILSACWENHY